MDAPITLVSGASGMIGSAVMRALADSGIQACAMVRRDVPFSAERREVGWNTATGSINLPDDAPIHAVFHLAAAPLFGIWSAKHRRRLWESRVIGTRKLAEHLAQRSAKPAALISASAYGYYGDHGSSRITEDTPQTSPDRFLAKMSVAWESSAMHAAQAGIRVVTPRIGVVMARNAVSVKRTLPLLKLGMGAVIGSGRNYTPWIMLEDVARAFVYVMSHNDISGAVNLAAPSSATQRDLMKALTAAAPLSITPRMPSAILKPLLGDLVQDVLTASANLVPQKLQRHGFQWNHPELEPAIRAMLTAS